MIRFSQVLRPVSLLLVFAGCNPATMPPVARFLEPELIPQHKSEPTSQDNPNACYHRDVIPAVVQTVTEQVKVEEPVNDADEDGEKPPVYRTITDHKIVQDRQEIWFETLCPDKLTPQFIASLQRALAARGYYSDIVSGEINPATRQAIRRYQTAEGLNSEVISIAAAKRLGLAVYERHEALAISDL